MCGRFALVASAQEIAREFGLEAESVGPLVPRYNIAPSQPILAVRERAEGRREATHLAWGLIPSWAHDPTIGSRLINVRLETADQKPAFRHAFRRRRCIVPASGFFEWIPSGGAKHPYYFHDRRRRLLGLAALWDVWSGPNGETLETCAIVTVPANEAVQPFHDRMPAILEPENYGPWLDLRLQDPPTIRSLLPPLPDDVLTCYRVSAVVNNPRNDSPACLEPVGH